MDARMTSVAQVASTSVLFENEHDAEAAPPKNWCSSCSGGKEEEDLEDLKPTPDALRTWGIWNFVFMWSSMAVGVSTYMLGSSLLSVGLNWWQATITVFVGSLIVLVPLILNGHSGVAYAISFPVFLRSSFGVRGAQFAALSRGVVGVGWFAFQVWVGGTAIYQGLTAVFPSLVNSAQLGAFFNNINVTQLLCFFFFLACHVVLVLVGGIRSVKFIQTVTVPVVFTAGLALFIWFGVRVGVSNMLAATYILPDSKPAEFWTGFWPALSAILGSWATMALNILDFTRYCRSQARQAIGQALGLPPALTLFAFLGIAATGGGYIVFGEQLWNPSDLFARFDVVWVRVLASLLMVIAVLAVNLTANVVSPANDIANIYPERITFKMGGLITCALGVLLCPWKVFADAQSFIFSWLIGYSAVLGAVGGVMLCDYYVLRRTRLHVPSLYDSSPHSIYYFQYGVNWCAMVAVLVGIAPCLPGFLVHIGALERAQAGAFLMTAYDFSWFVALAVGGVTHFVAMKSVHALQRRLYGSSGSGSNSARFAYDVLNDATASPAVLADSADVRAEAERKPGSGPVELEELSSR